MINNNVKYTLIGTATGLGAATVASTILGDTYIPPIVLEMFLGPVGAIVGGVVGAEIAALSTAGLVGAAAAFGGAVVAGGATALALNYICPQCIYEDHTSSEEGGSAILTTILGSATAALAGAIAGPYLGSLLEHYHQA